MDSQDWKLGIDLATKYINERGWTVSFSANKESVADSGSHTITINTRHPLKIRYFVLLHEIGHAIEMDSIFFSRPSERSGQRYNTLAYRTEKVRTEFEAWEKGKILALTNGWPMDNTFIDIQAKFIAKYMAWAIQRTHTRKQK